MEISTLSTPKGRPREFCTEQALTAALRVFWRKGFDGASLTDLTEAMGITRPSLYAAFGNKEELFRKALDLYGREKLAYVQTALAAPTARAVAERMLRGSLDIITSSCDPAGCFGVISSVACTDHAESIRSEVVARRAASEKAIIDRFRQAHATGDLPANVEPEGLARYVCAVTQGMSVQASAGATRADLEQLIDITLQVWPSR
jgi:AcrR family transcriptional regulator